MSTPNNHFHRHRHTPRTFYTSRTLRSSFPHRRGIRSIPHSRCRAGYHRSFRTRHCIRDILWRIPNSLHCIRRKSDRRRICRDYSFDRSFHRRRRNHSRLRNLRKYRRLRTLHIFLCIVHRSGHTRHSLCRTHICIPCRIYIADTRNNSCRLRRDSQSRFRSRCKVHPLRSSGIFHCILRSRWCIPSSPHRSNRSNPHSRYTAYTGSSTVHCLHSRRKCRNRRR